MYKRVAGLVSVSLIAAGLSAGASPAASNPVTAQAASAQPSVGELTTNGLDDPLGIAVKAPSFSWQITEDRRGVSQSAYQVRVASSPDELADANVWDSGKVSSDQSLDVAYEGPALKPRSDYVWSVRIWDDKGAASDWSEPARFGTGLGDEPWKAKWIGDKADKIGEEWTDYTIDFTASDIAGALGVYFRGGNTENAYMWQLSEADDALRPHVKKDGTYSVISTKPFPEGFDFGAEHDYSISVEGSTITTSVDGEVLDERTDETFAGPGIMGFRTSGEESGVVHDVTVTDDGGEVLVETDFPKGDRTFAAGTVTNDGLLVDSTGGEAWLRRDESVPLLRKDFDLADKDVARARVYASARGVYELRLNGERVGDNELAPGWTDYRKRIDYQTYDVTDQVRAGENVLGAEVASGWYSGKVAMFGTDVYGPDNSLIAELVVDFEDGSQETIATDGSWQTRPGPTTEADLLDGESYDARIADEVDGWDEAGYGTDDWSDVVVRDEPTKTLEPQTDEPVRVTQELTDTEQIDSPTDGAYLYDLGQNMVGHARITLQGEPGQTVRIRHGEVLQQDGSLYTANLRSAKATDYYTFSSDEPETFEPSFTFHGFRYVEITGVDEAPDASDVVGVVVGTDGELTSSLETNSDMVNQLQSNIVWGMRGNFLSIPTDTPARDERMGWTGDINVFARTAVYNMDARTFLTKWMQDLRDTQRADGALPGVAPIVPGRFDGDYGPAGWMDAGVHVPWALWQAYGDTEVIRENYAMMRKYVDYLAADSTDHIRTTGGYLDWLNLNDPTPAGVVDTAFVAKSTRELAQMAKAIGRDAEATELQQRYEAIRNAYQDAFIAADGTVKGDSQTSYILTLTNDLEPKNRRDALIDQFVETLERRDYHLSTGFLGVDGLLPALTDAGRTDIAYRLLLNEDYPSWGYEIGWDATTVWERWNSINPDGSFNDVGMNSFNHYAYGAVGEWMYRTMAGVSAAAPGYKKVLIAPEPGDGINQVDFSHDTRYGTVRSAWSVANGPMTLDVTVPANTTAQVRVPAANRWAVTEGGKPIADVDGVEFVRMRDGDVVLEVGSGTYAFAVDKVLGDIGAAADRADTFSGEVDALEVRGVFGKIAKKHLQLRTKLMTRQIAAARRLHLRGVEDQRTATAVHRALASVADLDRWTKTYARLGQIDGDAASDLRSTLSGIERPLSSASSRLVGAVASLQVPAGEIVPGDVVRVKAQLENSGKRPLNGVESTLDVPDGWSVEPVGGHRSSVRGHGVVAHAYDVTVPADAEVSPADLTGTVSYRYTGGTATLPVSATLMVSPGVAIESVSAAPKAVGPGEQATVSTTLVNQTGVKQSGEVALGLPEGWEAPAPVAYDLAPGDKTTVDAVVSVPKTVVARDAVVTASTGETPAERARGAITVQIATPPDGAIDHVDLGDGASEKAHNLAASEHSGTNTEAGLTRRYTHSTYPDGWFEFDLEVPANGPLVVRAIETFDDARRKTYNVEADGEVVYEQDLARSESGQGTVAYQFVIDDPGLTSDGTVRLRFQDTGADYDPSIADVWSVPAG